MSPSRRRPRVYVLREPRWGYAPDFMRAIQHHFGLRAVAWYGSDETRREAFRELPLLHTDAIEAVYHSMTVEQFAGMLSERYDVAGVVPCHEPDLDFAAEVGELLGLGWNPPEVLRRFRDKAAQKDHLTRVDGVRVAWGRRIRGADAIVALTQDEVPEHIVLKPAAGAGNQAIGMFARSDVDAAARHLAAYPELDWLVEEYVDGPEFNVNGFVRPDGTVVVLTVFEVGHVAMNGHPSVYDTAAQVASTHPAFWQIVDYTERLLAATGLRCSPFHLELKLDHDGPCMIDLAARFGGSGHAWWMERAHPNRPSPFTVAVHDMLGESGMPEQPIDWATHDARRTVMVYGWCTEATRVRRIDGVGAVERMPSFLRWAKEPTGIGIRLPLSRTLSEAPFIACFTLDDASDVGALAADVRATVRWNAAPPTAADRARLVNRRGRRLLQRVGRRLARPIVARRATKAAARSAG